MRDETPADIKAREQFMNNALEAAIRLFIVGLILVWCFQIFRPFLIPTLWGLIIAVALFPLFGKLKALMRGRGGWAAALFALVAIAFVLYPSIQIADSIIASARNLSTGIEQGTLNVPPPSEKVLSWPLIGQEVHDFWGLAATNLEAAVERVEPQLRAMGLWLISTGGRLAMSILQTIIAIIIAAVLMASGEAGYGSARSIAARFGGDRGAELVDMSTATVRSVAQGILGIAIIQSLASGLLMFIGDVPAWGVWTVLILILAVIQLPPLLILGPVAAWVFSASDSTLFSVVFLIIALIISGSDAFLKPLLLARGVAIPMPVILVGAIGGMMLSGIIGLFIGAVVFSIGYKLFRVWMEEEVEAEAAAAAGA